MSTASTPALRELALLREHISRELGSQAASLTAATLAQLEALAHSEAPDPSESAPLLDLLEDLLEASMRELGWPTPSGGPS